MIDYLLHFCIIVVRIFPTLLATLLLCAFQGHAQTWNEVFNAAGNNNLEAVIFLSTTKIVAVGQQGARIYSHDGGTTWFEVAVPNVQTLNSLSYSGSTLIAVGASGTVVRSTNDGQSWTDVSPGGNDLRKATASFIASQTVLAIGANGTILRSTNDGINWNDVNNTGINKSMLAVAFNGSKGVIVADKSGNNFTALYSDEPLAANIGTNWVAATFNGPMPNGKPLNDVAFINASTVVAAGDGGIILRSTDSGQSWDNINHGLTTKNLTSLYYNGTNVIALGVASPGVSTILYSQDSGASWNMSTINGVDPGANLNAIASKNAFVMAVGDNGTILESQDSGASWIQQTSNTNDNLLGVDIINPVIVVGQGGGVFLSTDQASAGTGGAGGGSSGGEDFGLDGSADPLDVPFGGEWLCFLFVAGYGLYRLRS